MSNYFISLNPFAEFSNSSKAVRTRIIKQQLTPNKLLIPWYQYAKSILKKYFSNINDLKPITEGIDVLNKKSCTNQRQVLDKTVSIEALQKVPKIKKPRLLSSIKYDVHRAKDKDLMLNGVLIRIAPDVIIKAEYEGKIVYGGVKFHVKKTKPFELDQAELVSSLLYKFLKTKIAKKGEIVLPELCLCFDVFSERIVSAPIDQTKQNAVIRDICEEIKSIWPKSA